MAKAAVVQAKITHSQVETSNLVEDFCILPRRVVFGMTVLDGRAVELKSERASVPSTKKGFSFPILQPGRSFPQKVGCPFNSRTGAQSQKSLI